jgi:hypothetical protein
MIYTTLTADQISTARETLYESIPITGTLVSGTYGTYPNDTNVLKYTASHGLFESVYDYPYASSSANHIFDLTYGVRSGSSLTPVTQSAEKYRIYKEMAQTLLGFDVTGNVKNFVINGTTVDKMLFVNFSRLLTKDGIKIGSFTASIGTGSWATPFAGGLKQLSDNPSSTYLTVNSDSPVGQYWKIYSGTTYTDANQIGFLFYQQGVLALNQGNSIFDYIAYSGSSGYLSGSSLASTGTITEVSDGFRRYVNNLQFQNTVQINSTIYNCQVGLNQYNYSSNITYTSASQIVVKNSVIDTPITYITTVGLYDDTDQLLAVAKLSEPLRKTSADSINLRVRLDY